MNFYKIIKVKKYTYIFIAGLLLISICQIKAQSIRDCRAISPYVQKLGFNPQRVAFSTSERLNMGLTYVEFPQKEGDKPKIHQHPSWDDAGWLGPMVITEKGDVWVAPIPVINLLHNKPEDQTKLWKMNGVTGQMSMVLKLPSIAAPNANNPFGLLGLAYDCDNQVLYATSVSGSTLDQELGSIFAIRTSDLKILSRIDSVDALAIGVGYINGEKRVCFGSARTGNILSIQTDKQGNFLGKPRLELSLEGQGPRGDDRARKIRFAPDGTVTIHGVEFYFNLIAPTEKQETVYQFKYLADKRAWMRVQ